jgi:methyl-accepting chemotaxis protein
MDYDQWEKTLISLKLRMTFFVVFFFIAVFVVFVIISVLQVNTVTRFVCSRLAMPANEMVSALIDGDRFEDFVESPEIEDPYYEEIRLQMLDIKTRVNCSYLYTMAPVTGDVWKYIIDGSAPPDDAEHFSPLGFEEDISSWDEAFRVTVRTRTAQIGIIDQNEEWGSLISAYMPILNSSDELVGIIGCDLAADAIIEWIRTQVMWQAGVVVLVLVVGLIVYLSLIRSINRLLRK